ncbi:hypothetical protein [Aquamicrobium sp.]|uniref:hypothetical protein n=1 Tax=Aquamicrobium sp. TaxID=1872579 RepID=UPI00258EEE5B|nr:hypothetical protein [Aquamicrobium sp.]MCK9554152.1 hypothetical protein [Aquamicrobium sp.]
MPALEHFVAPVFYAPTKRRRYLTAQAAAHAEARAMIERKYPTEGQEYEHGHMTYSGWHWSSDERLLRAYKRLSRLILRQLRGQGK